MILIYGLQFICDLCGVTGQSPERTDGTTAYHQTACPDGWTNVGALNIHIKDHYGTPFFHLCPDCGQLSINQLATRLDAQLTKEKTDAVNQ
jgi:hypothetical protein